ncbi:hypothetical protein [Pseudomonas sp. NPDC096925]|uniref:hypothetical protein n=1 Tax=Pseudomonas sp. NPDC096925 TaxID=3364484 RepID=UPI00383BC8F9
MNARAYAWLSPAVFAVGAMVGCASSPENVGPHSGSGWTSEGKTPLTQPIAFIADTQIHESRGVASRYFNRSGDEFVPVTLRTGQQVIGEADVLLYAMERAKSYPLVIHAGDALDVSCATEWDLFTATMDASGHSGPGPESWLLAPGNHDGFLTGNMYPKADRFGRLYVTSYWSNLCNAGRVQVDQRNRYSHMPKEKIVERYAAMLAKHKHPPIGQPDCNANGSLCWVSRIRKDDLQWTSYIVQRVRLPSVEGQETPIYALLIDSSDFARRPYLNPSSVAGLHAGVSADQLRSLKRLVADLPSTARYFFVAHHPFGVWGGDEWDATTRALWVELNNDSRSMKFLVSAHTHEGALFRHSGDLGSLTELNTGSLSDAPIYLRNLWFEEDSQGRIGFRSLAFPLLANQAYPNCPGATLSSAQSNLDYSVRGQDTESDRANGSPMPIRYTKAFLSAVGHFFRFWSGKHDELRPQLLAYADVAERAIPNGQLFTYYPFGELNGKGVAEKPRQLQGGTGVAEELRMNANCKTGQGYCSVQAKGNLLLALERYFWFDPSTPKTVKTEAHQLRLCLALAASAESPYPDSAEKQRVDELTQAISSEWASQLSAPTSPVATVGGRD